jgi:hypothetical protein
MKDELLIEGRYEDLFENCKRAIKSIRAGITSTNKEKGEINGVRALSMTSWGERIKIRINSVEKGCRVEIESKPLFIDWSGKNKKNVDLIKSFLMKM